MLCLEWAKQMYVLFGKWFTRANSKPVILNSVENQSTFLLVKVLFSGFFNHVYMVYNRTETEH